MIEEIQFSLSNSYLQLAKWLWIGCALFILSAITVMILGDVLLAGYLFTTSTLLAVGAIMSKSAFGRVKITIDRNRVVFHQVWRDKVFFSADLKDLKVVASDETWNPIYALTTFSGHNMIIRKDVDGYERLLGILKDRVRQNQLSSKVNRSPKQRSAETATEEA